MPSRVNSESRTGIFRKLALEPSSGRPNAVKKATTVSGMLRNTVTYAVPMARSGGTGEIRRSAISVPMIRAPAADNRQICRVSQKPLAKTSNRSTSTFTVDSPSRSPRQFRAAGSVPVDRGNGRHVLVDLAGGVLPGLLVPAVGRDLLQGLVDKLPERGVALLQADAVRLLGELLADQL